MAEHVIGAGSQRLPSKKPPGPQLPDTKEGWFKGRRLFVVLELASLETSKTKRGYQLLTAEEHSSLLLKHQKDAAMYRPDILHQALMTLLDSPLNKAGMLKVFIHTQNNVLIDVNPRLRVPRTYSRFAGLMVQLLYQKRIRAVNGNVKLLKCIKHPITQHLPPGAPIIGTSVRGDLVDIHQFVERLVGSKGANNKNINNSNNNNNNANAGVNVDDNNVDILQKIPRLKASSPVVFVFGAQPHGEVKVDYTEHKISISQYPLSSQAAISRVLSAFEKTWGVL